MRSPLLALLLLVATPGLSSPPPIPQQQGLTPHPPPAQAQAQLNLHRRFPVPQAIATPAPAAAADPAAVAAAQAQASAKAAAMSQVEFAMDAGFTPTGSAVVQSGSIGMGTITGSVGAVRTLPLGYEIVNSSVASAAAAAEEKDEVSNLAGGRWERPWWSVVGVGACMLAFGAGMVV
ncbi:hypothetical protein ANO11243_086860 [Dothideomycetidae sp. 11243]|nr:hypothetical protein ANO11243_086860 [fungal sp. No.11243]